jgi:hypothetical protein
MRLLPRVRLGLVLRRRHVDDVMHPSMPARRYFRGLSHSPLDHPAPFKSERRIDFAFPRAVIAIAEFVLADEFTVKQRPKLSSERRAVPPRKKTQQESLHRRSACCAIDAVKRALMPFRIRPVQGNTDGTGLRARSFFG